MQNYPTITPLLQLYLDWLKTPSHGWRVALWLFDCLTSICAYLATSRTPYDTAGISGLCTIALEAVLSMSAPCHGVACLPRTDRMPMDALNESALSE